MSPQDGDLPIHYAAYNGHCDVIQFLYECDPTAFSVEGKVWFLYLFYFFLLLLSECVMNFVV